MADLLITVDTEADDEWTWRERSTTHNGQRLPTLQDLCDRHGVPVVYLVTWDMLQDPAVAAFLRGAVDRGVAEVGAHLHTWRTPPFDDRFDRSLSYAHELPVDLVRRKLESLTRAIGDAIGVAPTSYRAGRYGFTASHVEALEEEGYLVDSSVTPWTSWRAHPGLPGGPGGADFVGAPEHPYRLSAADVRNPGESRILEVPLSIRMRGSGSRALKMDLARRGTGALRVRLAAKMGLARREELRPAFCSTGALQAAVRRQIADGAPVLNTLLHSSELLPGASPYNRTEEQVDGCLRRLESLVQCALENGAVGSTLARFHESWSGSPSGDRDSAFSPSPEERERFS